MAIVKRDEAPAPVQMDPGAMMQAIVDKGITPESVGVMKDLLAVHDKMRAEAAKSSFAAAFADLRRQCGKIMANKVIPTKDGGVKGKFASLTELQDQIEPLLERHGFFWTFDQERVDGGMTRVTCRVVHRDGHEMSSGFTCREHASPLNSPAQNDGGTNTLAKRVAICNMFGIRIDYDADARMEGETITAEQAAELERRAGEVYGGDAERMDKLLKFAGATSWQNVRAAKFRASIAELAREERRRAVEKVDQQPEQPNVKECPEDAGRWLAGMEERCAELGMAPSEATKLLAATFKKYGATSHLTMTADARALAWNNAHKRK